MLSDFGLKDPYVAEMKAVIMTICPEARIIDISHSIEKFNIRAGAFVLASAAWYFPKDTIHVAVVDPTVGTKRRALLVETEHAFYIGPDNGLLMLAAQRDGIRQVYAVTNLRFMLPRKSHTFHGRDVFAPVAAHLASGTPPTSFGSKIEDYAVPTFAKPQMKRGELKGQVLHIDDFGNVVTNIMSRDLDKIKVRPKNLLSMRLGNKLWTLQLGKTYGDVAVKSALALIGSHDFLEIALNQGNAANEFKTKVGDTVTVSLKR